MLNKLQRSTLSITQIVWYVITLFIGATLTLLIFQLYSDLQPLLKEDAGALNNNTVVISKKISMFKSMDKERIYFTPSEIDEMAKAPFTKTLAKFTSASFKVRGYTIPSKQIPAFYTELFLESVPKECLDIDLKDWKYDTTRNFVPVVIPESYLKLYNFGFAESQGLPVISKNMISQFPFKIEVLGNGASHTYKSRIIGFSNKINSILVPEEFMNMANAIYGSRKREKINRLLIEFHDPTDKRILSFFNQKNYSISKDSLMLGKWVFLIKSAMAFVFILGLIITILSLFLILLSIHLIIQKNKEQLLNLYHIGYRQDRIASFYRWVISVITVVTFLASLGMVYYLRGLYISYLSNYFDIYPSSHPILVFSISLLLCVVVAYNILLRRQIAGVINEKIG